jgi:hypothetical protein
MSSEAGQKRTAADIDYVMRWIVQVNASKTLTYIPNNIASLAQRVLAEQSLAAPVVEAGENSGKDSPQ